jgi:hypothetical protein
MSRVRTPGDQARYNLYVYRQQLLSSDHMFPSREAVSAEDASFEDVLFNTTIDELKAIPDHAAIELYEYTNEDGEQIWPQAGSFLLQYIIGWDDNDTFYSDDAAVTGCDAQDFEHSGGTSDTHTVVEKPRRGGRKPSEWWPEAMAQGMYIAVMDGHTENASEIIGKIQERVAASGCREPSPASLRKAISRFYELMSLPGGLS